MTREVAIDLLSMIEFEHAECCLNTWYKGIDDDMKEALDMAIKALEQETCADVISRQAVLDVINTAWTIDDLDNLSNAMITDMIKELPSVSTEKKNVEIVKFDTPYTDTISRQAAIDAMREETCLSCWDAKYILEHLPPVSTEKTGRWIDTGSGQECSNCHEIQCGYDNHRLYCANCGSRNEVVKE